EVGSRSSLPGLDESLIEASSGDIKRFETTLPEGFGRSGGQNVTIQILVKEIKAKRLPQPTDQWVSDVSEFETVEEMREQLRVDLGAVKAAKVRSEVRSRVLQDLLDEVELDLPEALIGAEMESVLYRFTHRLETRGSTLEDYLRATDQQQQAFLDDLRKQAVLNLRTRIVLEAVTKQEGIEVEPSEIDQAIVELAEAAGEPVDKYRTAVQQGGQEQALVGDILRQKALDRVVEHTVAVDPAGRVVDIGLGHAAGEESEPETDRDERAGSDPAEVGE
ncbi:MAG: hypothetical protein ACE5KX_07420, partial [Acidimicrobiia bacterium]